MDAISSFLADDFDMNKLGVQVMITTSSFECFQFTDFASGSDTENDDSVGYVESINIVVVRMGSKAFLTVWKHSTNICNIEFVCVYEVKTGVSTVFIGQVVDG